MHKIISGYLNTICKDINKGFSQNEIQGEISLIKFWFDVNELLEMTRLMELKGWV
jgi:hypothetical protein